MNLFVVSLPSIFVYILPRIQIHMSYTGIAVGVADPDLDPDPQIKLRKFF